MCDKLSKGEPFFKSNVVDVKPFELDVTSEQTDDDASQEESLLVLMSPLLNSMRLFGQYFQWPSADKAKQDGGATLDNEAMGNDQLETVRKTSWSDRLPAIYAVAVLTMLWINGIRLLTIFTSNDTMLPIILNKGMMVLWTVMCSVQQTAYFAASRSGNLDRVLGDFRLKRPECKAYIRRLVAKFVVVSWTVALANEAFFVYLTYFSGGYNDMLLTPFGTHIPVADLSPFRAIFIVLSVYLNPAWIFPVAMTFLLSISFAFQFRRILDRLRRAMTDAGDMGIADDELEDIRREHQTVCRLLKRADRFLTFHHMAALFGPLVIVIIILYIILFHRWMLNNSPILFAITSFWLISSAIQLSVTAAGGVMVNHYAHKIRERVHNISLSKLNSKTIGKINVLLNRTSGEPIGFSVVGIMIIDRNALISLMGLLITYFLLVVQLSSSDGATTSAAGLNATGSVPTTH